MSARPEWIQVFLDTPADAFEEAVGFWSAVTGWAPSERRGEDGQFLTLLPPAGSLEPTLDQDPFPPHRHQFESVPRT